MKLLLSGMTSALVLLALPPPPAGAGEFVGSCVQWVKYDKPAYRNVNKGYWVPARDLWDYCKNRGATPRAEAVMVLDSWPANGYGHVGCVVHVDRNRVLVRHSNWDYPNRVSLGVYTIVNNGKGVTYNGGGTIYPLRGFVYSAN
jgi:hypothetical protein